MFEHLSFGVYPLDIETVYSSLLRRVLVIKLSPLGLGNGAVVVGGVELVSITVAEGSGPDLKAGVSIVVGTGTVADDDLALGGIVGLRGVLAGVVGDLHYVTRLESWDCLSHRVLDLRYLVRVLGGAPRRIEFRV